MKRLMVIVFVILNIVRVSAFGTTSDLSLTLEEKQWLEDNPVIYYAPDPGYAPYEYIEDGLFQGMVADYLSLFEESLNIEIEVVDLENWSKVIEAAQKGEVNMTFATQNQERNTYLIYTEPIIDIPNVIVTNDNFKEDISEMNLRNYSIAYLKDYAIEDYIDLVYPDATTVAYESIEKAIQDVSQSKVDTFLGDIGQISHYAKSLSIDNLTIKSETAYRYSLRFAFPKDQEMLRGIIEKTQEAIGADKRKDVRDKWITLKYNKGFTETQQMALIFVVILMVLAVMTVTRWNSVLKIQVAQKTAELKTLNKNLEKKVVLRTRRLEESNNELEASVNDLLSAQEKLVEAQKNALLGELIVGIAHELSTPLGSSLTSISYVQEKTNELTMQLIQNKLSLKDVASYADMTLQSNQSIIKNLERSSKIIERFMSLESSQWSGHKEKLHLGDIFKDIIVHVSEFDYRLMSYEIRCVDTGGALMTSANWWYEILRGLMMNTLLHGYDGLEKGEINIQIREVDGFLEIQYEDHGKGIDEAHINQVLEPFYTTSSEQEHIGLGLPILKNLINKKMNGSIRVESELGAYTRFIITIPQT